MSSLRSLVAFGFLFASLTAMTGCAADGTDDQEAVTEEQPEAKQEEAAPQVETNLAPQKKARIELAAPKK